MIVAHGNSLRGKVRCDDARWTGVLDEWLADVSVADDLAETLVLAHQVRVLERVSYAIEDMGALPDEYWCPDYAKIEADTKAGKAIPGVRRIVEKHTGAK